MVELSQCVVEQVSDIEKYEIENTTTIESKPRVAVIGTGWFGRAIAKRLLNNGFDVYLASRNPGQVGFELPCEPTTYDKALEACHIVFLCIPWVAHLSFATEFEQLLRTKTVVDIANPGAVHSGTKLGISIAERLQRSLPGALVVKGFNTISAYSMGNDIKGLNREVCLCSDYPEALKEISSLTRTLGYIPVDSGTLSQARIVEAIPLALFEEWHQPTIFVFILLFFFIFYNILSEQLVKNVSWAVFPLHNMNSIFASTSMNLFAVANLAGCIANVIQLWTGTAQQQFSPWLASWLNHRKQLGLYGFMFLTMHLFMSFNTSFTLFPKMNGLQESSFLVANISTIMFCVMCITSLPSVGNSLSWREWRFVQSWMGWAALTTGFAHDLMLVAPLWKTNTVKNVPPISVIASILPTLTLATKLVLLLPFVQSKLNRVQRGN
ncbi:hypothetical protein K493DRAFT_338618 [Basidiobolus meristosporus CBS 931.73]|uniref:Pyrroline-5-carboxylate reductase catalytic N-terminal domain-containing protein n=1 Tax=Basidiobolus meristosporus CBS 931.73 TaxID=1314790 RepID=A0A1Y1Y495_9FUNG|nr:hypothetical protein K493DRAFT_338618 [Basidiobolus meristosporus CBS 931.73]|eukprot:ORX92803.1 hypothetical protein K493DRAFT_338618 [Basidiobolus meristosporus CBS 931.73]